MKQNLEDNMMSSEAVLTVELSLKVNINYQAFSKARSSAELLSSENIKLKS